MTLTADEVRQQVFRVAFRGYDVEQVDGFLDRLERDLRGGEGPASPAEPVGDTESHSITGRGMRVLQLAEQAAEQLVAEARAEAARLRAELAEQSEREREELERRLRELRDEVDQLQRLEQQHRDRMVALLTEQLHLVRREGLRPVA